MDFGYSYYKKKKGETNSLEVYHRQKCQHLGLLSPKNHQSTVLLCVGFNMKLALNSLCSHICVEKSPKTVSINSHQGKERTVYVQYVLTQTIEHAYKIVHNRTFCQHVKLVNLMKVFTKYLSRSHATADVPAPRALNPQSDGASWTCEQWLPVMCGSGTQMAAPSKSCPP